MRAVRSLVLAGDHDVEPGGRVLITEYSFCFCANDERNGEVQARATSRVHRRRYVVYSTMVIL